MTHAPVTGATHVDITIGLNGLLRKRAKTGRNGEVGLGSGRNYGVDWGENNQNVSCPCTKFSKT